MSDQVEVEVVEKKKQGRTISKGKNKVFTPAVQKLGDASYEIVVPFNDDNGDRKTRTLVLVSVNGQLAVTG